MTITPGSYYRRKSDGIKLMALENYDTRRWRFYVPEGQTGGCNNCLDEVKDVEPWTEPKKKVKLWPALYILHGHGYYIGDTLHPDEASAKCGDKEDNAFIRLVTEYPAIEVEEQ